MEMMALVNGDGRWGHKPKNTMITVNDTFNGWELSRHRTVKNAVIALRKFWKQFKKRNGNGAYITTNICCTTGEHTQSGKPGLVSEDEIYKWESWIDGEVC